MSWVNTVLAAAERAGVAVVVAQGFEVDQGTGGTHRYRLPG